MITETMRHELKGEWLRCVIEDGTCYLTLPNVPTMGNGAAMSFKEAAKVVDELAEEIREIRERLDDLGGVPIGKPESNMVYERILAANGKEARSRAVAQHYVHSPDEVFTVTRTEKLAETDHDGPVYRVSGWTKPREKAPRNSLKKAVGAPP
jgi:hypothetical protein